MPKKYLYSVSYCIFVNGSEHAKEYPFTASSEKDAIQQCDKLLKRFNDPSEYKIHNAKKSQL